MFIGGICTLYHNNSLHIDRTIIERASSGLESNSFSIKCDQDFQIEVRIDGHGSISQYRPLEATSFLVRSDVETHLRCLQLRLLAAKYKERKRSSRFE